ncbi:Protein prenyltransferase, alpha subunit [Phytophthora cactorum]|nr:Protein prenyltransferase, alpha subunit [Phytophthora cactorum]
MATGEALLARLSGLLSKTRSSRRGLRGGIPLFQAARMQFHPLNALLQQEAAEITQSKDNQRRSQLLHCSAPFSSSALTFTRLEHSVIDMFCVSRKSFVTRGWLDAQDEVQFTNLVFTLHPKSIDTWAYGERWLAIRLCESLSGEELRVLYEQQIEVCSRLAEQKPRNYHAWSFRHWIVSCLPMDLARKELQDMEHWCRTHVTDHSGWNHRQHTLNELMKKCRDAGENKFVSDIMASYPTHEALWCHRRYVMQCFLNEVPRNAISEELALLDDLSSRVAGLFSDAKPESIENAALSASWDEIFKTLSSNAGDCFSVFVRLCTRLRLLGSVEINSLDGMQPGV